MIMRNAVTASVGLMVLGLVPFSTTHWGMMLQLAMGSTGAMYGSTAIYYFLTPVIGIMLFQMGCLFFASGMEEAFNPRLRTQ
jgi:peptide/nickel transport system permease protein